MVVGLSTTVEDLNALTIKTLKQHLAAHKLPTTGIIGTNNCIADAISRFQMDRFRSLAPHANPHADPILALPIPSSANCETTVST